jgi:putative FmdB family regulatory protein
MPLYDYECPHCQYRFEAIVRVDDVVDCPQCGRRCQRLPSFKVDIFKPFWHEDFGDEPVYIESKQQYKELCKKHGVYAPYVFGKGWNIEEI